MNPADTELPESAHPPAPVPDAVPPLPMIWIGYLLGVATIIAEFVAVSLDPQLAKAGGIPPLYLFLVSFIGGVYWFVCIYRYHVILAIVTGKKYPISPARAVGFHFIPFYQFYWVFRWPIEIARFVNFRLRTKVMRPTPVGVAVLGAIVLRVFDPGFGLLLLFFPLSYVSECIRRALAASTFPPPAPPVEDIDATA